MSDDKNTETVDQRLQDTSKACLEAYNAWEGNKKDSSAREKLQEATHELRKVTARLEIELAASERDEMKQKPIPIPPHRANRRKQADNNGQNGNDLPAFLNNGDQGGDKPARKPRQRRTPRKSNNSDSE